MRSFLASPSFHRLWNEAWRFLLVGGLNFILTFVVFYWLFRLIGFHYLLSLTVSWAIGMLFTYALNFTWVFKPEERLRFRRHFGKYLIAQSASILLNLAILHAIVARTGFDAFYVQCALIPFIVVFNFCTAKFWSMRRGPIQDA